ncbi:MAG: hypothetical protein ACRDZ6_03360 [Acidimicrobiales bacterium]
MTTAAGFRLPKLRRTLFATHEGDGGEQVTDQRPSHHLAASTFRGARDGPAIDADVVMGDSTSLAREIG